MKIVFVTPYYTEGMGYIGNRLPAKLAELGHEVHLISSTGKVYFTQSFFKNYKNVHEKKHVVEPYKLVEGVHIHRVPHLEFMSTLYLRGLWTMLKRIQPDVVHTWEISSPYVLQIAVAKPFLNYKMFSANHYVLSVFALHRTWHKFSMAKLKWVLLKKYTGKFISMFTDQCFPATNDARFVAVKYMGMPLRKCKVTPLGVDTDLFKPITDEKGRILRNELRKTMGYSENDIVCIYTGRFAADKNPLVLAKAVDKLQKAGNTRYKGLFIGVGEQESEIKDCEGCQIIPFEKYVNLWKYYQASDIGVWPTQESTSMIDAAACGIPIVISNQLYARERVSGNGIDYEFENVDDMSAKLLTLEDASYRQRLGQHGSEKMKTQFSWDRIAEERIADYTYHINKK
ncbi:hypothetical protein AEM51_06790 [Bacteroidetes bacterium UKL13-3]|nr:hypothetical protein AEM51_06790 [Bacteroidetes bacterium UKL13-3]HCP93943.1 hypothetical protein [Bacteroidota bacterium]